MRKILIAAAAVMTVAVFQPVAFAAPQDDLKEHGCLTCHDMDKKKVGPGYNEVAAKNKGKKVEELMASMKGKPVHKGVLAKTNDAQLKTMLEFILTK